MIKLINYDINKHNFIMSFSLFIPQGSTSHNGVPFSYKFTQFRKLRLLPRYMYRHLSRFAECCRDLSDTINFPRSSEQVLRRGICIQYSKFMIDQKIYFDLTVFHLKKKPCEFSSTLTSS